MLRIVSLCLLFLLISSPAQAKFRSYFGVSGGINFGGRFTGMENETCVKPKVVERKTWEILLFGPNTSPGPRCRDIIDNHDFTGLKAGGSGAWGIKYGFYSDRLPFFGAEILYFERYPQVERQSVSATGSRTTSLFPTLPFSGTMEMDIAAVRTLALAAVFRPFATWPNEGYISRIKPFFGLGIGFTSITIDAVRVYDNSGSLVGTHQENSSGTGIGFPVYAGFDFIITDSLWLTSEYIFSQALGLLFENLDTVGETRGHYLDHTFMFGLKFFWDGSGLKK